MIQMTCLLLLYCAGIHLSYGKTPSKFTSLDYKSKRNDAKNFNGIHYKFETPPPYVSHEYTVFRNRPDIKVHLTTRAHPTFKRTRTTLPFTRRRRTTRHRSTTRPVNNSTRVGVETETRIKLRAASTPLPHAAQYHSTNESLNRLSYYAARFMSCREWLDHNACAISTYQLKHLNYTLEHMRYEVIGDVVAFGVWGGPLNFSAQIWEQVSYSDQYRDYRLKWTSEKVRNPPQRLFEELHDTLKSYWVDYDWWSSPKNNDSGTTLPKMQFHTQNRTGNRLNYYAARHIACHNEFPCTVNSSIETIEDLNITMENIFLIDSVYFACYSQKDNVEDAYCLSAHPLQIESPDGQPDYIIEPRKRESKGLFWTLKQYHNSETTDYDQWNPENETLAEYEKILNSRTPPPTNPTTTTTLAPPTTRNTYYTSTVGARYPGEDYVKLDRIRAKFYQRMYNIAKSYLHCRGNITCFTRYAYLDDPKLNTVPFWFAENRCILFYIVLPASEGGRTVHITFYEKVNEHTGTMISFDFLYSTWHNRTAFYQSLEGKPPKYTGPIFFNSLLFIYQLSHKFPLKESTTTPKLTSTRFASETRHTATEPTSKRTPTTITSRKPQPTRKRSTAKRFTAIYVDDTASNSDHVTGKRVTVTKGARKSSLATTSTKTVESDDKTKLDIHLKNNRYPKSPVKIILQKFFNKLQSLFTKTIKQL